ncbi:hypothetical protein SOVF_172300 [Spinacia oleracea]|nr:hypothetical protein SOVF_172300 [Spinacia oleracea]
MASVPPELPPLPEAVEEQLGLICHEKSLLPADAVARRYLSEVGEQESFRILNIIRNSGEVRKLSGFIVHLVKNSRSPRSPLPASPTISPQGNTTSGKKRKMESDSPGGLSSVRRVCIFNSPTKIVERVDPPKSELDQSTVEEVCILNSPTKIEEKLHLLKSETDRVLDALEKLEFRKTFLILNYKGCAKLEDAVYGLSADKILSYQSLGMRDFENEIWNDFGRNICQQKERINKGPYLNKAATLLQKTVEDENVLMVKFMEQETKSLDTESMMQSPAFNKVSEEGIFVGRKCYRFFVFKDGGKEEKKKNPTSSPVKCYFVCTEGFASLLKQPPHLLKNMSVQKARGLFMHIHKATNLSNYMARFSLILSKTITLELNYDVLRVEVVEDVPCRDGNGDIVYDKDDKAMIFTDGTGFISEDLAVRCPHNCFNGYVNNDENVQAMLRPDGVKIIFYCGSLGSLEAFRLPHNLSGLTELKSLPGVPPLLIQFRMFYKGQAIKGTVLVNRKLPPNTIQVRRSMLKIKHDEKLSGAPTVNSFEVVATSNKPKDAAVSKNLIALLHYGGVPKDVFLSMLWEAITKPLSVLYKTKAAVRGNVADVYSITESEFCSLPFCHWQMKVKVLFFGNSRLCLSVGLSLRTSVIPLFGLTT